MEEKCGDDQGSGWLQVKKKHRSNAKFSFQGWVGGFSKKPNTNVVIHEARHIHDSGTSNVTHSEPISINSYSSTPSSDNSNNANVPTEDKYSDNLTNSIIPTEDKFSDNLDNTNVPTEDKCVVSHVDEVKTSYDHELPQVHKLDAFPKIRFGNLDDGVLAHTGGNPAIIDIKFGEIGNMLSKDDSVEPKEREIIPAVEEDTESGELEDVKEVSSEDIKVEIVNEEVVSQNNDLSQDIVKDSKTEILESSGSENLVTSKDSSCLQESESTSDEKVETEMTKNSTEDFNDQHTASVLNEFSGVQMMSAIGPGEIEAGEGKERFRQRLWCFLFENLNRAVDELYLLCELECDVDQMKEAVLVLEEAASDFKELNVRVQEFEKVKKSSDNPPMTMKSEQRRPHALSWEVRRMTTSPHRAGWSTKSSYALFTQSQLPN